jgi:cytochrome P450
MMRDESLFDDALSFNAFRFVDRESGTTCNNSRLTDSSDSWLVWGAGRILCPGRFYATVILKLIVAHVITEYDVVLPEIKTSRSMQWRSAVIPKSDNVLLLRLKTEA